MTTGKGLRDWKWQRLSAIVMTVYMVYLGIASVQHSPLTFESWHQIFNNPLMSLGTLFVLICLAIHAWIGIWTVLTDYVKPLWIRYTLQSVILFALFGYVMWGFVILWGL